MARIGIDLDGVCYDFSGAFCRLHGWDESKITHWQFFEKDFGHTVEWFFAECRDAIKADRLFRYGDVIEGAKEALWTLVEAGHELHVITDRCSLDGADRGHIEESTMKWWEDEGFPAWTTISFTGDKAKVANGIGLDYFIDDKIENVEALDSFSDCCQPFLFDQPWNQGPLHLDRVFSWDDFVRSVTKREALRSLLKTETPWIEDLPREVRVTSESGGQKGQKQARLGSLDPEALLKVAEVAGFGEAKYDRLNYMKGYDWSLTFDAGMRHRLAFWNGEDLDPESGLPHLAHAAWHDLCLLAFYLKGLGNDNRYPTWVKTLAEFVEAEEENVA